tara:strand:- start:2482 stop:2646 length:165 start_codon:yes stop_codon:yes gene_type:complete
MRLKFEILSDDSINVLESDFNGEEFIKITRENNKLILLVDAPEQVDIYDGILHE